MSAADLGRKEPLYPSPQANRVIWCRRAIWRMVLPSAPAAFMVRSRQATATGGPHKRSIRRRIAANSASAPPPRPAGRRPPFERIEGATIRFSFREGQTSQTRAVRKPTDRWRGNPQRPERRVSYVDLSRIQPVGARVGYLKMLKSGVTEGIHTPFDDTRLGRFSHIMGKVYSSAGISFTSVDARRAVPVIQDGRGRYSGFHQGAGQISMAEPLAADLPQYGLVLIVEIETSLHPRAQRRLLHDISRIAWGERNTSYCHYPFSVYISRTAA